MTIFLGVIFIIKHLHECVVPKLLVGVILSDCPSCGRGWWIRHRWDSNHRPSQKSFVLFIGLSTPKYNRSVFATKFKQTLNKSRRLSCIISRVIFSSKITFFRLANCGLCVILFENLCHFLCILLTIFLFSFSGSLS